MKGNIKVRLLSVIIAVGVGAVASFFTQGGMNIYDNLSVPSPVPPAAVFPIVWTLLYILMGLSAAMIWENKNPELAGIRARALGVYAMSLFVNFTWCFIFFNFREFGAAFFWLVLLLVLIVKTIFDYRKINPTAAYLQIPYLLWVTFAGYLTLGIWQMN